MFHNHLHQLHWCKILWFQYKIFCRVDSILPAHIYIRDHPHITSDRMFRIIPKVKSVVWLRKVHKVQTEIEKPCPHYYPYYGAFNKYVCTVDCQIKIGTPRYIAVFEFVLTFYEKKIEGWDHKNNLFENWKVRKIKNAAVCCIFEKNYWKSTEVMRGTYISMFHWLSDWLRLCKLPVWHWIMRK